jgi:recombinational DNA repair protein RecR
MKNTEMEGWIGRPAERLRESWNTRRNGNVFCVDCSTELTENFCPVCQKKTLQKRRVFTLEDWKKGTVRMPSRP